MRKFKIGRNAGPGPLVHSFDLVRADDGRVLIQNPTTDHGPTDAQTQAIVKHMTSPVKALGGPGTDAEGRQVDALVTYEPGTLEHFETAGRMLPTPFFVMG